MVLMRVWPMGMDDMFLMERWANGTHLQWFLLKDGLMGRANNGFELPVQLTEVF